MMYGVMTLEVSLLHYQMKINITVNRNLSRVINN